MLLGAHVPSARPLAAADERGAEVLQIFLSAPRAWREPAERSDAEQLRADPRPIHVHSPYLINVASGDEQVRARSTASLAATCRVAATIDAASVVVHTGHGPSGEDPQVGRERWREVLTGLETEVPVLLESTAGGKNPVARTLEQILALFEALDGVETPLGFCLDTCHLHAAGEELVSATQRLRDELGRIDLIHLNDSRDPRGSARDRHENLGKGQCPPDALVETVRLADAPTVLETPDDAQAHAADLAWIRERLAQG
ncbi:MAG: deoxyribonuclease IV [Nitriliruptoraceae bacterium]